MARAAELASNKKDFTFVIAGKFAPFSLKDEIIKYPVIKYYYYKPYFEMIEL